MRNIIIIKRVYLLLFIITYISYYWLFFLFNSISAYSQDLLIEDFDDNNIVDDTPISWVVQNNSGKWSLLNGKLYGSVNPGGKGPIVYTGSLDWKDYEFEADITGINGPDRHLLFRYDPNRQNVGYAVKFRESNHGFSGIELQKIGEKVLAINPHFSSNLNKTVRIKIIAVGNNIKIYESNNLLIDYKDINQPILNGKIGFFIEPSGIGSVNTTVYDNVKVTNLSINQIFIQSYKQYDDLWGSEEYDSASLWSLTPTIKRWGCALTSASMILKYYGYDINPSTLNSWLKSQPDGYINGGLVNWIAITRYTKLNKNNNQPTLEYKRENNDLDILKYQLDQNQPGILKLPGHFVVASGYDDNNIYISDPASTKDKLSDISESYISLNSFIPTQSDLSYFMHLVNKDYIVKVVDYNNNIKGEFFVESPLKDDENGSESSGTDTRIHLLEKPVSGKYKMYISGNQGIYELKSYLYDSQGNYHIDEVEGITGDKNEPEMVIDNTNTPRIIPVVSIPSIKKDLDTLYKLKYITNKHLYLALKIELDISQKLITKKKIVAAKNNLDLIAMIIEKSTPIYIDSRASKILLNEISYLKNSI